MATKMLSRLTWMAVMTSAVALGCGGDDPETTAGTTVEDDGAGGDGAGGDGGAGGETNDSCEWDADCADDGDVCNGVPTCVDTAEGRRCVVEAIAPDSTQCDDGNACTLADHCLAGACVGGEPLICNAPTTCQLEGVCQPETGECTYESLPDDTVCDDGVACTENDVCSAGQCAGAAIVCPSMECHEDVTCDESTGMCPVTPSTDGTACDDSDLCTQVDECVSGVCVGAAPVQCNAGDDCNEDNCNPATGICELTAYRNGGSCDDESECNSNDRCGNGTCSGAVEDCTAMPQLRECVGGQLVVSSAAGVCSDALVGCEWAPEATIDCANGCVNGACTDISCSDPNNAGAACDDGDPCTENDVCGSGVCNGTDLDCSAMDGSCAVGMCDATSGTCVARDMLDGVPCDDGDACSPNDTCSAGVCTAGTIDEYDNNDAFPGAILVGVNALTNNINRHGWGDFDNAADEDWYHFADDRWNPFALHPRVQVTNLGDEPITLCAYHECKNGTQMLVSDMQCLQGQIDLNPPGVGIQGCCSTVAAGADSVAEVHLNPECGAQDEGEVYVKITSDGANGESCGYDMQWGDQ